MLFLLLVKMHALFGIPYYRVWKTCVATMGAMHFSVCSFGYTPFYFRKETSREKYHFPVKLIAFFLLVLQLIWIFIRLSVFSKSDFAFRSVWAWGCGVWGWCFWHKSFSCAAIWLIPPHWKLSLSVNLSQGSFFFHKIPSLLYVPWPCIYGTLQIL